MPTPSEQSFLERHGVALALLAGLIARVALISVVFGWGTVPVTHDDGLYVGFARAALAAGHLTEHHFPVGYVIFVVAFLKLGAAAFPAIRVTHVLLGLLTVVTVAQLARSFYGRRAELLAAWITALYPPLVFMSGRVMSETLFIALLMLSLLQFVEGDRTGSFGRTCLAGALFAVASVVRSNLVMMMPFIPLWLLLRRGADLRTRFVSAAACSALMVALLMLPGLYFLSTKGEFLPFATNAGQTFYGANNPLANGGWVQTYDHPELLQSIPPEVRRSPAKFSKAQTALGVKWIKENPGRFLSLLPRKFANAWLPGFQDSETTRGSGLAGLVLGVTFAALLLAAIAGRVLVKPEQRDGLLLAVLATYTVMSLAFYGNPRIGLFCAPVLMVYASSIVKIDRLRNLRRA